MNFGFCKDGNEVGKLEECRYNHDGGGLHTQYEDITPFCGYYIIGGLDTNEFYNSANKKEDIGKIELFQKLFSGAYHLAQSERKKLMSNNIIRKKLKDSYILQNHTGVIRGCFGARNFNQSKPEIQRGPGCHDIWRLVNSKTLKQM